MKTLYYVFAVLCFIASGVMYVIGFNNSHLSELLAYFYAPIPLGILFLLIGKTQEKKK